MRPRKVGPIDNVHSASARAAKAGSIDERLERGHSAARDAVSADGICEHEPNHCETRCYSKR